ncbi:S-layer homology domain-containing protein [Candidatus Dojkabacteria bacterium]|uniref:S-layer homology domain-containing protein n=1 Tax=Candidatus Dojkabacteria bacterium TaxID=2099670 RepID=A0A955L850_9BACT|nr:S-layer homology domain-containing protein [Candidatus Dojkabacteria bacterium]
MTKNLLTSFFILFLLTSPTLGATTFPDVSDYYEYANEIEYVKENGIVDGYTDGLFRPENQISRAELTKIVVNTAFSDATIESCEYTDVFPDVPNDNVFITFICQAEKTDILQGYSDGYFRPEDPVSFGQAAKIIMRALDSEITWDENTDLNEYLTRLDEKQARPLTLTGMNQETLVLRGEVSHLTQMVDTNYTQLPDEPPSPNTGYFEDQVITSKGTFGIEYVAANLATTRVLTDVLADTDCGDNCPVQPLEQYVFDNGGYAAVNGTYFCPTEYDSCNGKSNSFDPLVMTPEKNYINIDKNLYSTNPAIIFKEDSVEFIPNVKDVNTSDITPTGVISNYPSLVFDRNLAIEDEGDPKMTVKSSRGFIAHNDEMVYIGVIHNVSVVESGYVLHRMGVDNAINMDGGWSTSLWYDGYKVGPGRNLPNAIVFVEK